MKKKITALSLSLLFTFGTVSTALAETPPHLLYGTEKAYGEENTQHKPLYNSTANAASFGTQYAILPKSDTFSFTKEFSGIEEEHDVTIEWQTPYVMVLEGLPSLSWDENRVAKVEPFEYGKNYPVYPQELQDMIRNEEEERRSRGLTPISIKYNEYNASVVNSDEPIVVLRVTDHDLDYSIWWVYQVVNNWTAPETSATANTSDNATSSWRSDSIGWWVELSDGSYLTNAWYQSPASGLWYYMGDNGYMLTNTTTPDGCIVNADGVWVQ